MGIFDRITEHDYEKVVFCRDGATNLRAIIAIHDTSLGPALGGVRMRPYATEEEALEDVLRLARGMTYKASISGVDLGGGKSVVIANSRTEKTPELLEAMGQCIESLGGAYIAGQDIGTDSRDMAVMRGITPHVSCVHESAGGAGDPSFATGFGVVAAMRAVLRHTRGSDSLSGRRIAIQGVGNVGHHVARYCQEAGAKLTVTDIANEPLARASSELSAFIVAPNDIYDVECDVFSPCSVGSVVNDDTVPRLNCLGVVGSANNQLAEPRHADALRGRGILYGPDYLVNSGGLIRCQEEVRGAAVDDERILGMVSRIYDQTLAVIRAAEDQGITTAEAADWLAEERIASHRRLRR